jgi:ABC-type bacteriocin/lantibiotic exporter with double-glycine peptidase domain
VLNAEQELGAYTQYLTTIPPLLSGLATVAIARASRVRLRPVTLDGLWWQRDSGPLLATAEPGDRPVALLPARTGYELVDPATRGRSRVTPEVAASLSPTAHVFYRPLPDRTVVGLDLVRFGLHGCARDLLVVALMGALGGLLALVVPLAVSVLFDQLVPASDTGGVVQLGLVLLACACASAAFQLTRGIATLRIEGRVDASLQAALWDRLLTLPVPFFRAYSAGDLAVRAMGIDTIRQVLTGVVVSSVVAACFSVFSYGLLFV